LVVFLFDDLLLAGLLPLSSTPPLSSPVGMLSLTLLLLYQRL
jgi:hypothetical protein